MICKNCKHSNWKLSGSRNWGECLNPKVEPLLRISLAHVDIPSAKTSTEYKAGIDEITTYARIQFDEDIFGCTLFEPQPNISLRLREAG